MRPEFANTGHGLEHKAPTSIWQAFCVWQFVQNLSNLSVQLQEIEAGPVKAEGAGLGDVRLGVVKALENYKRSRYRLGEELSAYKKFFLVARGWMSAAKTIAGVLGCDERNIRRIVDDFDRVSEVPAVVIKALEVAGIDPAARKNAGMIAKILMMPNSTIDSDPEAEVLNVLNGANASNRSSSRCSDPALKALIRIEKRRLSVRKKIHTALSAVPDDQKLEELVTALERVYFERGQVEPVNMTITPRPSEPFRDDSLESRMIA